MCGISGIISKNDEPVSRELIQKFNNAVTHRGPDGDDVILGSNFALGHRRLRILDLSENGRQPMVYQDKVWLTFNGEVYNYLEIKKELVRKGYAFRSTSDTEVILAAYLEWGIDCVKRFNGMWAFILFDQSKQVLFICRDRFGVKPLYYTEHNHKLYFGSELKQLAYAREKNVVDEYMLLQKLVCHLENHHERTMFKDIYSLPPSSYMVYDLSAHAFEIKRYYEIAQSRELGLLTESESAEALESILQRSISLRLRSDVRVGTCLSGGIDSSFVSAVASKQYTQDASHKFMAINAKSIQKSRDESSYAKQVADYLNLDLRVVEPSYEDFKNSVDDVVLSQDEPFGSPSMFMGFNVFKKARQEGCIVMLNGQGGDEILLGYERYFVADLLQHKGFSKIHAAYNYYRNSRLRVNQTLLFILYFGSAFLRKMKLKHSSHVKTKCLDTVDFSFIEEYARRSDDIFELQKFEIEKIQLPKLLRYEDRNSMVSSIETRLPFLDYNVVETALSLKNEYKIKDGWSKYILRKITEKYVPNEIAWRKNKFGFESPEEMWLEAHRDTMINEIKDSELLRHYTQVDKVVKDFDSLPNWDKWLYYNTAVWARVFNIRLA